LFLQQEETLKMNKDGFEGGIRSTIGQGEKTLGQATGDKGSQAQGAYDDMMGKAQSALDSAKDAVSKGVDAVSALDYSGLRDEIANGAGRRQLVSVGR
jgi:uncharacterized protein YjbJ (UPF0337 family)